MYIYMTLVLSHGLPNVTIMTIENFTFISCFMLLAVLLSHPSPHTQPSGEILGSLSSSRTLSHVDRRMKSLTLQLIADCTTTLLYNTVCFCIKMYIITANKETQKSQLKLKQHVSLPTFFRCLSAGFYSLGAENKPTLD